MGLEGHALLEWPFRPLITRDSAPLNVIQNESTPLRFPDINHQTDSDRSPGKNSVMTHAICAQASVDCRGDSVLSQHSLPQYASATAVLQEKS